MSKSFYSGLLAFALLMLFHAAYSTTEWRHHARKTDKPFGAIPLDIAMQVQRISF